MSELPFNQRIRIEGNAVGSAIVSGNGNTVYVIHQVSGQSSVESKNEVGKNPYQGLASFKESDADRYFGREEQVERLWKKLQALFEQSKVPRVLPVLGPSGCGKSSLVRAGLLPELAKRPLPNKEQMRVAVLVPGNHPIEALAGVLARVITNDPVPLAKTAELEKVILKGGSDGTFDGLRRIAALTPGIQDFPLVILIDQFEEVYSLCKDNETRENFIETLLKAAKDPTGNVNVIITLRSDFLKETQQNETLNSIVGSDWSSIVPAMTSIELRHAIVKPAEQAGYSFDESLVDLLIKDTEGREGALPLLQFALSRMWEDLRKHKKNPADVYWEIGRVGGALVDKAQEIYDKLDEPEQKIAKRLFIKLINIEEGKEYTRRRISKKSFSLNKQDREKLNSVLERFTDPKNRLLVTWSNTNRKEHDIVIEIAHESLISNWKQLQSWLNDNREVLWKKQRIEQAAQEWRDNGKEIAYLFQDRRSLRDAKDILRGQKVSQTLFLSDLEEVFLKRSFRNKTKERIRNFSFIFVIPFLGTLILVHLQLVDRTQKILTSNGCEPDPGIKRLVKYLWQTGYKDDLRYSNLCSEMLQGLEIPGANMPNSNFENANLSNTDFQRAILLESSFKGASLEYSDFRNSFLMKTDFQCTESECTEMSNADFQGAIMIEAKLQGAFLENTNFAKADLSDANFARAEAITTEQLKEATLCGTVLPDYITNVSGNRDCPDSEEK